MYYLKLSFGEYLSHSSQYVLQGRIHKSSNYIHCRFTHIRSIDPFTFRQIGPKYRTRHYRIKYSHHISYKSNFGSTWLIIYWIVQTILIMKTISLITSHCFFLKTSRDLQKKYDKIQKFFQKHYHWRSKQNVPLTSNYWLHYK